MQMLTAYNANGFRHALRRISSRHGVIVNRNRLQFFE